MDIAHHVELSSVTVQHVLLTTATHAKKPVLKSLVHVFEYKINQNNSNNLQIITFNIFKL